MLGGTQNGTVTEKITYLLDNVLNNKEMLLTVVAFALTIVVVYMIRRMSVDHAWTIAIVAGAVTDVIVLLAGQPGTGNFSQADCGDCRKPGIRGAGIYPAACGIQPGLHQDGICTV